jgi:hypothetical protein
MLQPGDLAFHVLKLERQLEAYQKLHTAEMGELWQVLNECKRALADIASTSQPGSSPTSGDGLHRDGGGKEERS